MHDSLIKRPSFYPFLKMQSSQSRKQPIKINYTGDYTVRRAVSQGLLILLPLFLIKRFLALPPKTWGNVLLSVLFTMHTHTPKASLCWADLPLSHPQGLPVTVSSDTRNQPPPHTNRAFIFKLTVSSITQSCPTLCDSMDYSLPGSSIHGIFQAIVLEQVAISFSKGSSWPRDRTRVSHIVDRRFTRWATREVLKLTLVESYCLGYTDLLFYIAMCQGSISLSLTAVNSR